MAGEAKRRRDDATVVRTLSLTDVLEKQIELLIVEGELAPGERLNEIRLAARFGTSRGPLREATRSLEAKGLVEVIRNRGVFVRQLSLAEALEVYDVRAALLGLAGRLLAPQITDSTLARLNGYLDAMEAASAAGDFERYYPLNLDFHHAIVEAAGNRTLQAECQRFVKKMHLFRAQGLVQGGGLAVSNDEHREMVAALASRDPGRAEETHRRHVERGKARLLAAMQAPAAQSSA